MSSRTLDGWVTKTKSKAQIAKDAQKAKNARKTRKPKQKKPVDEDDYEEDDFVVDDESIVSVDDSDDEAFDSNLEDEDEEEDDELILHDDDDESDTGIDREVLPTSKRRGASSVRKINKYDDDSSSSDDDEEGDSFLPTGKARPSAPSRLLKAKTDAAKNGVRRPSLTKTLSKTKKRTSTVDSLALLKQPPAMKKHKATNPRFRLNKDNDDDDEELTSPLYTPNKATKTRPQKQQPNNHYEEVFSSDEENESKSGNRKPDDDMSRYFDKPNKPKTIVLDDDSDDDSLVAAAAAPPKRTTVLEDTPEPSYSKAKTKKKTFSIHESSDEDSDDGFDEDTRVAMRLSLQDTKKKKFKSKIDAIEVDDANNVEMVLLDESSDDDDDGDQGDEYYDQEKETATNVLRSAEQLSAHVVRAMSSWFGNNGQVQGIIVDGAIALGDTVGENESEANTATCSRRNENKTNTHEWISKSVMKKAIPNVTLSGYQLVGVNWMALLYGMTCQVGSKGTKNVNGVLADEMGLGKTVQTISFLAWLRYRRRSKNAIDLEDDSEDDNDGRAEQDYSDSSSKPHLIVVPVSTLPNWMREFEKFCPDMHVIKYHGTMQEREAMKEDLREHLPKNRNKYVLPRTKLDVIVAPVSYFQKENSPDRKFLSSFDYDYLVVDEAHNLKNSRSTRYKMLDKVRTEHRLLLTGTPVQNNPQELLNMLSFIMPLFSKAGASFEDKDNYTEQMLKHFVDETAEHGDEQTAYEKLKKLFAPFVLRRKKADVIAQLLPPKERKTIFVDLSESTRSVYEDILDAHVNKNGTTINPGTGENLFTNLRKCAHHPLLLRTRWNTPTEKEQLIHDFYRFGAFKGEGCTKQRVGEEMESWNDFSIHLTALDLIDENEHRRGDLQRYVLDQQDLFSSSKFESLRDLLPNLIKDGHRILIFSSWTSCLDLLGCLMQHLHIQFQRMDGSCPSDERQRLIDRFNNDFSYSVFLLSTKACGLGINLTSADTCIIHDLDFNPFNDLQAEDRCHRIGQKKPVTVYKLITRDSVDEDIYKMQEKKAKMNAAIMDSSSSRKEKSAILKSVLEKAGQKNTTDDEGVII